MTVWQFVGPFLVAMAGAGFIQWLIQLLIDGRNERARKAAEHERYKALFHLVMVEALEQIECWLQYWRQSGKAVSFSQPYTFTTPDQILKLTQGGASREVLQGIYLLRAANLNISNQVQWGQQIYFQVLAEARPGIVEAAQSIAVETFARARAFVDGHWDGVEASMNTLVIESNKLGPDFALYATGWSAYASEYKTLKGEQKPKNAA